MGQYEKLLEKLKESPQNLTFEQIEKILLKSGFKKRKGKGSHFIFSKTPHRISIPVHNNECKITYKEDVRDAIFSEIENEEQEGEK